MQAANPYLTAPIPRVFIKTAAPIILLTSVNGLLTVVDAIFLGAFVGPDALTAVTLMFPLSMLLTALATMVSSGMGSVLGRLLGAGKLEEARRSFAGAHGLALGFSFALMLAFAAFGWPLVSSITGGDANLAQMGHIFLSVSIFTAPIGFVLMLQSDALRIEGRVGFMAITGLFVSLANMAFNYGLIVWFGLGVAGSAAGTVLAQLLALVAVLAYRATRRLPLSLSVADLRGWRFGWKPILALGAPRSLTFIGISLGATAIIVALRLFGDADVDASVAAYGVITRLVTFAFFPLLGMSLAMQAIVGNNFGAGLWARSNATLRLAVVTSLVYSGLVEALLIVFRDHIGALFVSDPAVQAEVARIIPMFLAFYFTFGPMMMISNYLQSIGDARRAALLALSRTYAFAIPLTFVLPLMLGATGIWLAAPIADILLVAVTALVVVNQSRATGRSPFRTA
ncbi:hypothetical protein VW23_018365 [Devosia insulae DS-56]|uniref:Multidrug export protein MepA n=1 Tax=Devosia insulae DS-56 TaxID=1116389 RepID=A0A1E5XR49_9HYPH|nr:MATE family efflux transporter [Devosia insulae]OEO31053.1 hypothetical protein VW23_018365 [Devosia insulae DS-56]